MYRVETESDRCNAFVQQYRCCLVDEENLKTHIYRLRAEALASEPQGVTRQIDEFDSSAQHLLLQDSGNGDYLAGARFLSVMQRPMRGLPSILLAQQQQGRKFCELNTMTLPVDQSQELMALAMSLCGYALGRLQFFDYLIFEIPIALYKEFQNWGWPLLYAGESAYFREDNMTVAADLSKDLSTSALCYPLSQHISNCLAPFVNNPILSEELGS